MEKIICILGLFVMVILQQELGVASSEDISAPVAVRFGHRPGNCFGKGLCALEPPREGAAADGRGILQLKADNRLELVLHKSTTPASLATEQFAGAFFEVQADLMLETGLCTALGQVGDPVVIPAGRYPVTETDSLYLIHF